MYDYSCCLHKNVTILAELTQCSCVSLTAARLVCISCVGWMQETSLLENHRRRNLVCRNLLAVTHNIFTLTVLAFSGSKTSGGIKFPPWMVLVTLSDLHFDRSL